jgi:hypothetical protein
VDEKSPAQLATEPSLSLAGSVGVLLFLVAVQLVVQLNSHFWLDETLTYWTTNGGLAGIIERCTAWPNSIVYSTMFYGLRSLGVSSPWIFRVPSLVAVVLSALLLFRVVKRLFGVEVAWITIAGFVSLQPVQFAAGDARPYGIGLLAAMVSTDLFLRLMTRPSYRLAGLYGLTTAMVLYCHLLFGASLMSHVLYGAYAYRREGKHSLRFIVVAVGGFAIAAGPLIHQYLSVATVAASHSFTDSPHPNNLLEMYFPTYPALALLVMFITAAVLKTKLRWTWDLEARSYRVFAVLWAVTGPLILYTVSSVSPAHVFVPRYFLPYSGGLALCLALVAGFFERRIVATVFIWTLAVIAALQLRHVTSLRHTANLGDWGAALAVINKEVLVDGAPVLMRSQFPESNFVPLSPVDDNPAFCQLSFYRTRARVVPLPATFGPQQRAIIDDLLHSDGLLAHRFLFVSYNGPPGSPEPFLYYIEGRLGPGWQIRELGKFDGVAITEFNPGSR